VQTIPNDVSHPEDVNFRAQTPGVSITNPRGFENVPEDDTDSRIPHRDTGCFSGGGVKNSQLRSLTRHERVLDEQTQRHRRRVMAMDSKQAPIIGLVGGIGSGKSAVARWLADHYPGELIDADCIGHEALRRDEIKQALRQSFGEIVFADGEVDRARLAAIVFGSEPEHRAARLQLESVLYPSMERMITERIAAAWEDPRVRLILFDAAVMLETGWRDRCDVVAFIDAPRRQRIRRVAGARGWSEDEFHRREASQWPLERKRDASDVVIDNSGAVAQAGGQLADYLIEQGWLTSPPGGAKPSDDVADAPTLASSP
jgi:dephospho-CoA kinase